MKTKFATLLVFLITFASFGQEETESTTLKPALLIIDVQKEYTPMMSQGDQELALQMMNWSMWLFRKHELPIIRVYHTSPEWGMTEESPGFPFHDSLKISEEDPMVIKTYGSAFTKTNLDELLKEKDVNTLFLCGLSSVGCVLATYMDAANYDYKAFMIKDAMLSNKEEYTDKVEEIFNAIDLGTAMYMLDIGLEK